MATSPTRPIDGSIGSRIRVILGKDGNSWMLLLNHDDGNRKWQVPDWTAGGGACKQINNCVAKNRTVQEVDFGPDGTWYVHGIKSDGTGGHAWWGGLNAADSKCFNDTASKPHKLKAAFGQRYNSTSWCLISGNNGYQTQNVEESLNERLKKRHSERGSVDFVRLFHDGGYFIKDSKGTQWNNVGINCEKEIRKPNLQVNDLAIAEDGSWLVIRPNKYVASTGVDKKLTNKLDAFYRQQRERKSRRDAEIAAHHERERANREAAQREAQERECAAREEAERREAAERAAREEADRLESERLAEEEKEREKAKKAAEETKVEAKLVEQLSQEKESIDKLERSTEVMQQNLQTMQENLQTMQESLQTRKRALRDSVESLPPSRRPRWLLEDDVSGIQKGKGRHVCVICQERDPVRAIVPCGHLCICDDCEASLTSQPQGSRLCPLCREPLRSTLKIFGHTAP